MTESAPESEREQRNVEATWVARQASVAYARTVGDSTTRFGGRAVLDDAPGRVAAAGWDGVMSVGTTVLDPLRDLHTNPTRNRTPREWADTRFAITALAHELSHFRTPADSAAADATQYNRSRGTRALEEGVTELQAQLSADDFVRNYAAQTQLPDAARDALLQAQKVGTYAGEVDAVRGFVRRTPRAELSAAVNSLDRLPMATRAERMGQEYLRLAHRVDDPVTEQRRDLRELAGRTVERHFGDAAELGDAAAQNATDDLDEYATVLLWHESEQQQLTERAAQAHESYAAELDGAADDLAAGVPASGVTHRVVAAQDRFGLVGVDLAESQFRLDAARADLAVRNARTEITHWSHQHEAAEERIRAQGTDLDSRTAPEDRSRLTKLVDGASDRLMRGTRARSDAENVRRWGRDQGEAYRQAALSLGRQGLDPSAGDAMRRDAATLRSRASQLRSRTDVSVHDRRSPQDAPTSVGPDPVARGTAVVPAGGPPRIGAPIRAGGGRDDGSRTFRDAQTSAVRGGTARRGFDR